MPTPMRQRVLAILNGQKPDCVPWLGDLSYWHHYLNTAGLLEDRYKGDGIFQMHRDLGCGFYLQGHFPYKTVTPPDVKVDWRAEDGNSIDTVHTPAGNLSCVAKYLPDSYCGGVTKHYVDSVEDLKVIRHWYEHKSYQPDYAEAHRRQQLIGDNGVVLCYQPKSPIMEMVAILAGVETTMYLMMDAPDEFDETMRVIEASADRAAEVALASPAECLMIPENLSSEVVGKTLFERYMRPYEERWNARIRAAGKHSFVHMDGTLRGLLREVGSTGFRVMEALTPAPVGDVAIEDMASFLPPGTIIWGGLPGLYFTDLISDAEFEKFTIHVLEVMRSQPRYVLGVADQVPPKCRWERIRRVAELTELHGRF